MNCTGQKLQRAPTWSGNARYAHKFDLANGGNITVGGTAKFSSSSYLQLNFRSPNFKQEAYHLFDLDPIVADRRLLALFKGLAAAHGVQACVAAMRLQKRE